MTKISLTSAFCALGLMMTGCMATSAQEADNSAAAQALMSAKAENVKSSASSYMKPGAAIAYSHNLSRRVEAGETVTFQLNLQDAYASGAMSLTLSGEGVSVMPSSGPTQFDMAQDAVHVTTISFTAPNNGRHYINVTAIADSGDGQAMPRTFSIPVQVGDQAAKKFNPNMQATGSGETLVIMDAEEEIK